MTFRNVIAIDDDSLAGEAIKMVFSKKGISVDFFDSPKKAILHIKDHPRKYKMAIVDFQMKEVSGDEVVKQIKKINGSILTVVLSGDDSIDTIKKCQEAGADNFYSKGEALDNLALLSEVAKDKYNEVYTEKLKELNEEKISAILSLKGQSNELAKVADLVNTFSVTNEPVLIQGASGTGKERIAKAIHNNSNRSKKSFIAVNCGAIPDNLLESELFGHEKGSFTGATHAKAGKFLAADGGTIFLDEIGEMPLDFQVKLLRVLQEKEVTPVGSNRSMKVNFRVVAATNRDLKEEVKKGNFREDLFYRLNILPIEIPSLMKRREDIISIAKFIIEEKNNETGQIKKLTDDALGTMKSYNWPGNVRQLEAVLKRAYVLNGLSINSKAVEQQIESDQDEYCYKYGIQSWKDLESEFNERQKGLLDEALKLSKGNKRDAAKMLNLAYTTYLSKRIKFGLDTKTKSTNEKTL